MRRWEERAGVILTGASDGEGNLCAAVNESGVSVIGDDYPGLSRLSADGKYFIYADHRGQPSPHLSPVVVAHDVGSGVEVGRWTLDGMVTCLEAVGPWFVVCETDLQVAIESGGTHEHLSVINVLTDDVRRIETRTRVFLP